MAEAGSSAPLRFASSSSLGHGERTEGDSGRAHTGPLWLFSRFFEVPWLSLGRALAKGNCRKSHQVHSQDVALFRGQSGQPRITAPVPSLPHPRLLVCTPEFSTRQARIGAGAGLPMVPMLPVASTTAASVSPPGQPSRLHRECGTNRELQMAANGSNPDLKQTLLPQRPVNGALRHGLLVSLAALVPCECAR